MSNINWNIQYISFYSTSPNCYIALKVTSLTPGLNPVMWSVMIKTGNKNLQCLLRCFSDYITASLGAEEKHVYIEKTAPCMNIDIHVDSWLSCWKVHGGWSAWGCLSKVMFGGVLLSKHIYINNKLHYSLDQMSFTSSFNDLTLWLSGVCRCEPTGVFILIGRMTQLDSVKTVNKTYRTLKVCK